MHLPPAQLWVPSETDQPANLSFDGHKLSIAVPEGFTIQLLSHALPGQGFFNCDAENGRPNTVDCDVGGMGEIALQTVVADTPVQSVALTSNDSAALFASTGDGSASVIPVARTTRRR